MVKWYPTIYFVEADTKETAKNIFKKYDIENIFNVCLQIPDISSKQRKKHILLNTLRSPIFSGTKMEFINFQISHLTIKEKKNFTAKCIKYRIMLISMSHKLGFSLL